MDSDHMLNTFQNAFQILIYLILINNLLCRDDCSLPIAAEKTEALRDGHLLMVHRVTQCRTGLTPEFTDFTHVLQTFKKSFYSFLSDLTNTVYFFAVLFQKRIFIDF